MELFWTYYTEKMTKINGQTGIREVKLKKDHYRVDKEFQKVVRRIWQRSSQRKNG